MRKIIFSAALAAMLTGCEAVQAVHAAGWDKAIFSAAWDWITSSDGADGESVQETEK